MHAEEEEIFIHEGVDALVQKQQTPNCRSGPPRQGGLLPPTIGIRETGIKKLSDSEIKGSKGKAVHEVIREKLESLRGNGFKGSGEERRPTAITYTLWVFVVAM